MSAHASYGAAIKQIEDVLGQGTELRYPGSSEYDIQVRHWAASSSEPSTATVAPVSAEELAKILHILGATRTPFAIKSGGNATNLEFSSTPGVLIAMSHFNETTYHPESNTATIGVGQPWEDVYAALEPYKVSVTGSRSRGVGVGGFISGGGFSWQASERGLAIDNVVAYEVVRPTGQVAIITEDTDNQLFWALKGTGNNFGIITRVTMKTFPQDKIWGGSLIIAPPHIDAAIAAVAHFEEHFSDPKASINAIFNCAAATSSITTVLSLWYGKEQPPDGLFHEFLKIPAVVSDLKSRTAAEYFSAQKSPPIQRGAFEHVPVTKYTLQGLRNWIDEAKNIAAAHKDTSLTATVAFLGIFSRSILTSGTPVRGFDTPSAWPPSRDAPIYANGFWALYSDEADDERFANVVCAASNTLREQEVNIVKNPNNAHAKNTPEEIYGSALPKLRELQKEYDPEGVMKLTGGFKI